nr:hypothetical protein GCM10020063_003990 [Dactylosporangium thailandense]
MPPPGGRGGGGAGRRWEFVPVWLDGAPAEAAAVVAGELAERADVFGAAALLRHEWSRSEASATPSVRERSLAVQPQPTALDLAWRALSDSGRAIDRVSARGHCGFLRERSLNSAVTPPPRRSHPWTGRSPPPAIDP